MATETLSVLGSLSSGILLCVFLLIRRSYSSPPPVSHDTPEPDPVITAPTVQSRLCRNQAMNFVLYWQRPTELTAKPPGSSVNRREVQLTR